MPRSGSLPVLLLVLLFVGGCAASVYESSHPAPPYTRDYERNRPRRSDHYYDRVERDTRRYVDRLDAYLHLSRRQEQRICRLLADRVYELLDRAYAAERHRVYPFPRSYERKPHRTVERWWHETDRRIEKRLTRKQRRAYRAWVSRDYRYNRRDLYYDRRH